jgi:hypothetical protein
VSGRDEARARRGASNPADGSEAMPAHTFGRRRRPPVQGRGDRRSLVTRLPVVVLIAAVLAGALAVDDSPAAPAGDAGRPADLRPQRLMPAAPPSDAGSSTWYCAAGTAADDGMADHTVILFNPTDEVRAATLSAYTGDIAPPTPPGDTAESDGTAGSSHAAARVVRRLDVPAHEQVQVRLADLVDAPLAAALVEVDGGGVAVEHRVAGPHGADTAPCASTAASTWHVAWGATTRDARDVVVLFNPFPSSATVDAAFTTEDGGREPVRFQGFPLPPGSVVGVDLGADVTRSEQVSATFTVRSGAIVVEHLQQHDGSLGTQGLSLTPAVPAAGETWVFADSVAAAPSPATPAPDADPDADDGSGGDDGDGGDGGDQTDGDADDGSDGDDEAPDDAPVPTERIVVYNPGEHRAEVDVSLVPMSTGLMPAPQPFRLRVGPGDYQVVDYGAEARVAPGVQHATVVRSTNGVPVVAERVAVDQGTVPERTRRTPRGETPDRRTETAASTGSRLAAPVWRFPTLADPDDDESTVTLTVYNPDPLASVEVEVELTAAPPEPEAADDDAERTDADSGDTGGADGGDADDAGAESEAAGSNDPAGTDEAPTAAGLDGPVTVPPGALVAIELDAATAAGGRAASVVASGPVVVDRVVRLGDGRRRSSALGIPAAEGAIPLDELAAAGPLGGVISE